MGLLLFATDFTLTKEEEQQTKAVTQAAFFAWCLVNDYFSFEKEWQNFEANGRKGEIVSSVYIFMQWYGVDGPEAKRRLRKEIRAREQRFVDEKRKVIARGELTVRLANWFVMLDTVTAGNFAWSMTTARYNAHVYDPYPALRKAHAEAKQNGLSETAVETAIAKPKDKPAPTEMASLSEARASTDVPGTGTDSDRGSSPEGRTSSSCDAPPQSDTTAPSLPTASDPPAGQAESKEQVTYHNMIGPPLQTLSEVSIRASIPYRTHQLITEQIVLEPGAYVQSLPSKGVRNTVLDALEVWYGVPGASLVTIREIIDLLHNASLM